MSESSSIQDDPLLYATTVYALTDTIIAVWPDDVNNVPKALWPYHAQCDSLTVEDGLIMHGEAIIVPPRREEKHLETDSPEKT